MSPFLATCWPAVLVAVVGGYLLGSINWAIILTRLIFHKDIREEGSGNAGATNMLRNHGALAAVLTTVGDLSKSMIAVLMGGWLMATLSVGDVGHLPAWLQENRFLIGGYIGGISCLLGHDFPLFYGFRGGKGVLSTLGMFLVLDWRVAVICLGIFLVIVAISRMVSLGSVLAISVGPGLAYYLTRYVDADAFSAERAAFCTVATAVVAVLIIVQHRANIRRIVAGTENRLGQKKEDNV